MPEYKRSSFTTDLKMKKLCEQCPPDKKYQSEILTIIKKDKMILLCHMCPRCKTLLRAQDWIDQEFWDNVVFMAKEPESFAT